MSSAVVAPVIASIGRSAPYRSSSSISCGMFSATADVCLFQIFEGLAQQSLVPQAGDEAGLLFARRNDSAPQVFDARAGQRRNFDQRLVGSQLTAVSRTCSRRCSHRPWRLARSISSRSCGPQAVERSTTTSVTSASAIA